jgi:hypothetical protein
MATGSLMRSLSTLVRLAAVLATVFILAGLIGFLTDEVRSSSEVSSTRLTALTDGTTVPVKLDISEPDPPLEVEKAREGKHTKAREFIDDVGDVLMRPFTWVSEGSRAWVRRLLYSAIALLLYGLALTFLADRIRRFGDQLRREARNAAEAKAAAERRESGTYVSPA